MRVITIIPTKNNDTDTDPAITPMELLAEVEDMVEGVTAVVSTVAETTAVLCNVGKS